MSGYACSANPTYGSTTTEGRSHARRRRELAAATTARFLAKLGMTEREGRMTERKGAAATTVFPFKKNAWDFLLKSQPPLLHHIPF